MRILIIGGTGLISNYITEQLLAAGHEVSHFNRGQSPWGVAGVPTIVGDRNDRQSFTEKLAGQGRWDAVIDMICFEPADAQQLLDVFRHRTPQLIVASTIDVYAKPASRYPILEDEPHGPLNDYSRNKSICERMLLGASSPEFAVTIVRASHTYGPRSFHRGHVVHCFGGRSYVADRIKKGLPVIVHGDGSSFWTSCHARDVAAAFCGAVGNGKAFGKAYHAASDEWLTWNRYFEIVAEAMGAPRLELVHIPSVVLVQAVPHRARLLDENFRFNNIFDNSAARADLGFNATTRLLDGMRETIDWVKSGPGFEDSAAEPWYDEMVLAWRSNAADFIERTRGLDG